jgi:hypothetical protein
MEENWVIERLLRRIAHRLSVERALGEVSFALCLALFSIVVLEMVWPVLGHGLVRDASSALLAMALAGSMSYALWQITRRMSPARAARVADEVAALKDELTTAHWLLSKESRSPFEQAQVSRAAHVVQKLDPRQIVPHRTPSSLWFAGALAMLLGVMSSFAPRLSYSLPPGPGIGSEFSTEQLRAQLQAVAPDESTMMLDQALAALQRGQVSDDQLRQALLQARDAVDEADLQAGAAREALGKLATAMESRAELAPAAKTLREGGAKQALELLRSRLGEQGVAGKTNEKGEPGAMATEEALGHAEELGRELRGTNLKLNDEALNKIVESIRDLDRAVERQGQINQIRRRMDDLMVASAQRSPLTAGRFGNRANAANPTPAPETGNADMAGGVMFRQGAVARDESKDSGHEGSHTGAALGHSDALAVEGAKTERLDA